MNSVGIDISKGRSTIAVMRPFGEVVISPFEVRHTDSELIELARQLKSLDGETRVVMEATGNYHAPVAKLLTAQVDHYSTYIRHHPGWEHVGVYADEAKTGTRDSRENFQRMLTDCRMGKINHIITKSISRFSRNTVTLLETVRELKGLGISAYFEEQSIDTATADGELMLSILASYAQEESLSASENQKWRVKRNFEEGIPWRFFMLGYHRENGRLAVIPEEAEIVRSIFNDYLAGKGVTAITKRLNESGYTTQSGGVFHKSAVERILRNYAYTGNLLLQTKFRENHLTKVTRKNQGELPRYHAANTHEAIISQETFDAVQAEILRRKRKYAPTKPQ